jgi:hypothetical protein
MPCRDFRTFRPVGHFFHPLGADTLAIFKDSAGHEWRLSFDAFLLDDVRKEAGIDLADIASGGWLKVETDSVALGRVAAAICRDEIRERGMTSQQFVKLLRGETIDRFRQALAAEGADFFPQSEWSAIRKNLKTRKESKTQAEQMRAAMETLDGMSPEFRQGAMEAMREMMQEAAAEGMNSLKSSGSVSATGPVGILSLSAIDGLESAELPPVD